MLLLGYVIFKFDLGLKTRCLYTISRRSTPSFLVSPLDPANPYAPSYPEAPHRSQGTAQVYTRNVPKHCIRLCPSNAPHVPYPVPTQRPHVPYPCPYMTVPTYLHDRTHVPLCAYMAVPEYLHGRTHVPIWPYPCTYMTAPPTPPVYVPQRFSSIETTRFITLQCR